MNTIKTDLLKKLADKQYYLEVDINSLLVNYDFNSYEEKLDILLDKFKELNEINNMIVLVNDTIQSVEAETKK